MIRIHVYLTKKHTSNTSRKMDVVMCTLCLLSIIHCTLVVFEDGSSRIIRTDDTRESMEINDVYEGVGDYSRRRFGLNAIIEQST